ncbi:SusD/RagB family nutrient-binding outer membrane lipoprotein [Fulvivirga sp.]|uniref:SusD/RagB family nutrient-binding outer membrane lipoprotein n=1 Tax=Fulvivirga sp. TaxID=1931237 RepID=UPI0032EB814E
MKNLKYILLLTLGFTVSLSSCEYGDENIDPTRQADVQLNLILPAALTQTAYNQSGAAARLSGILMQHFSGFDAQQNDLENYVIDENALNNFWNFGLYGGVMKDAVVMIEKGIEEEQPYYVGIAKILMANALGTGTSIFGDMPYTEAFLGTENLKPGYDSQESIYNSIQTLLSEAITELSKPAVGGGPAAGSDLIFDGDAAKWIATAHALKARYFMHLQKVNNSNASSALTEIASAFTSSANQPDFTWDAASAFSNPYALFGRGRPNTLVINQGFVGKLSGDPREDLITDGDAFYGGATIGDGGFFWTVNTAPSPLISYTELKFIEAEALVRTGSAAAAQTAFVAAVQSSMDYMGVAAADAATYIGNLPDISTLSPTAAVEAIMNESYVALYGQAELEVWVNYRRTGFPALTPNPNGVKGNNPSGVIPRRITYPQNERTTNAESLAAAVANQGQNNNLDVPLWAFK